MVAKRRGHGEHPDATLYRIMVLSHVISLRFALSPRVL
jgi:hypothetical protein